MTRATVPTAAWTASYVALSAIDAALAAQPKRRGWRFVTKPALMPLLHVALRSVEDVDPTSRRGLTAAHALSWGGDVALLGRSEKALLAGLGSFFGAHVAYIATFLARRDRQAGLGSPGVRTALALWLSTAPVMSLAARRRDPVLGVPVAAYATVLAAMFATGSTLDPQLSVGGRRSVLTGTSLFLASDTMLGARTFLLDGERPALDAAVMATYAAAQALITGGVVHL